MIKVILKKKFKKIIKYVGILIGFLLLFYIFYPKKTVILVNGSGWIFSDSAEICRCLGFSKGITNNWLNDYHTTSGNPKSTLKQNDYCIGVKYGCMWTNIQQVNLDLLFPQRNQ